MCVNFKQGMNIQDTIARRIFSNKYASVMEWEKYNTLLERGSNLLEENNDAVNIKYDPQELEAVLTALEYRIELLNQFSNRAGPIIEQQ